MDKSVIIAVDAMGGDYAPVEIVKGSVEALTENASLKLMLVGDEESINKELGKYTYDKTRVEIVHASEVIEMHDSPVTAIRRKKDSSMVKALRLVKEGVADGVVSAGSTGALLAGGTFIVGRIKGVERPALAPLIPTTKGFSLLIDCGANVDSKPSYFTQFAKMGSIYYEKIMGVSSPKVGLINIGTEEGKGNALVKEAYGVLKEEDQINFYGNLEARDVTEGLVDVLVCDAFVGNIVLKSLEGAGKTIFSMMKKEMMSSTRGKIGGLILKPIFKKLYKQFDAGEVGGAPLLGVDGIVIKAHGNSDSKALKNALNQSVKFAENNVNQIIKENI